MAKPRTKKSQLTNHDEEFDNQCGNPSNEESKSNRGRVRSSANPGTSSEQNTTTQHRLAKGDVSHSQASGKLWSDEALLCQMKNIDYQTSVNIVQLFEAGNTIPFMCRYRRDMINHLDADE